MASSVATPMSSPAAGLAQAARTSGLGTILAEGARPYSSSGIWVGVFAITMSFAAFTSALFVREGTADWNHLVLPPILYANTLLLLASSGTFELARRAMAETQSRNKAGTWMILTFLLGIGFCLGQYRAWVDLRAQGLYLATNPNSSFFYLLTALHALHVAVGILALLYLALRLLAGRSSIRVSLLRNTTVYWHFMAVLWVYLLMLCRMKL